MSLAAVLFDIDGTLLRAGGAGRRAFERALAEHAGPVDGAIASLRFDGMTDRLIVRESLARLGRPFEEAACDAILDRYVEHLREEIRGPGYRVLPGAAALLGALARRGLPYGLCTGNVAAGARVKLARGALDAHFDWGPAGMHGFAEDGEARERVVAAALRRVADGLGRPVAPAEVLVVGDTPRDVEAAHAAGCPALCLPTGSFGADELRAAGADLVAPTLDHPAVTGLLLGEPLPAPLPAIGGQRLVAVSATAAHVAALQRCLDGAPDYFRRTEGAPAAPDHAARLVADAEADERRRVFLLAPRGGGAALGVLDLWLDEPEPGTAHLGLLLVREAVQGRGHGAEAARALEQALARAGYGMLRLSVGDENPGARAFWERLGYGEVGRLDRGVSVMEKPLR